jgi:hypothetical protein
LPTSVEHRVRGDRQSVYVRPDAVVQILPVSIGAEALARLAARELF